MHAQPAALAGRGLVSWAGGGRGCAMGPSAHSRGCREQPLLEDRTPPGTLSQAQDAGADPRLQPGLLAPRQRDPT